MIRFREGFSLVFMCFLVIMEGLLHVNLINNLEDAEADNEVRMRIHREETNVFEEFSDREFIRMFRLDKNSCRQLIQIITPYLPPKRRPRDLSIELKILITLRFLASGSYQLDNGSNYVLQVCQPSVSRGVDAVVEALNRPGVFRRFIKFPTRLEDFRRIRQTFYEKHHIPGVIGLIDGSHVAIIAPPHDDEEFPEHVYINRKNYHSINVKLICDNNLKILNINARYPGSTNDKYIFNNSNVKEFLENLHRNGHQDFFLLGDSGYAQRTYMMIPLEEEPIPNTPESRYQNAHKNTRVKIENCIGLLKNRFRCLLKHRVLHYKPDKAGKIINSCAVLHNLCIENNIPVFEEPEDNFDYGVFQPNPDELDDHHLNQANPDLAAGRRARRRLIHSAFL